MFSGINQSYSSSLECSGSLQLYAGQKERNDETRAKNSCLPGSPSYCSVNTHRQAAPSYSCACVCIHGLLSVLDTLQSFLPSPSSVIKPCLYWLTWGMEVLYRLKPSVGFLSRTWFRKCCGSHLRCRLCDKLSL